MKVIGITGGIGSGKSLVAKIMIDKYGAVFINTDKIAKDQMKIGGISYQGVVDYFGKSILAEDGSINSSKLSKLVFNNKEKLQKLNDLTHPQVLEVVVNELNKLGASGEVKYAIIETALMIEAGFDYICDEVWYVYSPEDVRKERLMKERNYSEEKINSILESQSKDEDFRRRFSTVVENTGSIENLEAQIDNILDKFREIVDTQKNMMIDIEGKKGMVIE